MSWLPPDLKKAVVMIGVGEPLVTPKGSGAIIKYRNSCYAITAKHVIQNIPNPIFVFNSKGGGIVRRSTRELNEAIGSEWVNHSDENVDLSII